MSASTKQRNWALDCLRLVAVLLVVQRHQMGEPTGLFSPVWDALVRGGWVGVDIFFVLSGYLVGGLLFQEHQARGCLDWKRFLVRRGLKIYPAFYVWLAVAVGTAGNTLGGVITYWMGRGATIVVSPEKHGRYLKWLERLGPKALIFAWLPAVGDPLCAVAGWLALPFWHCTLWMAIGKALRYMTMTAMLMWVPDAWWVNMIKPFLG